MEERVYRQKDKKISSSTQEHPIIEITSNEEFANFPNKTGFGNSTHPYIIENLKIVAGDDYSIFIMNTDVHFIIRNCVLSSNYRAIKLNSADNGNISSNRILAGGIMLIFSDNHEITHNNIQGKLLIRTTSDHIVVKNNTIFHDSNTIELTGHDMPLSDVKIINNTLNTTDPFWPGSFGINIGPGVDDVNASENILIGQGISIRQSSLTRLLTHTIDLSNTINGKKIYFYKSMNDLSSQHFENAGQIILVDCHYCEISDLYLSDSGIGIALYHSDRNDLTNLNSYQIDASGWTGVDYFGIYLVNSDENRISDCYVNNPDVGIYLKSDCDENVIENCYIENCEYGILLSSSCSNNILKFNEVVRQERYGIYLNQNNKHNTILGNTIVDNNWEGITCSGGSNFNSILNNTIKNHREEGIILYSEAKNNSIYFNDFFNNDIQARDEGVNNSWANGLMGNFWFDYTGLDLNEDNIGDDPYNISRSPLIQDKYPLYNDVYAPCIEVNTPYFNHTEPPTVYAEYYEVYPNNIKSINRTWYVINGSEEEFSFSGSNYSVDTKTWNSLAEGNLSITTYVEDIAGNINFEEIILKKSGPDYNEEDETEDENSEKDEENDNSDNNNKDSEDGLSLEDMPGLIPLIIGVGAVSSVVIFWRHRKSKMMP